MLEFRAVSKVYRRAAGDRVLALSHASFTVAPGERLVVHGPPRAGKSTLVRLAHGAEQPSAGHVRVNGQDLRRLSPRALARVRRALAVVPQEALLPAGHTAFGQVALVLRALGFSAREVTARTHEALARVGLEQRRRLLPAELGGESWRVSLARALAVNPRLLLLDEPLPGGEAPIRADLVEILRSLDPRTTTLVLATRVPEIAQALGARTLALAGGELASGDDRVAAIPTPAMTPTLMHASP